MALCPRERLLSIHQLSEDGVIDSVPRTISFHREAAPTSVCHPSALVNKILIGFEDGVVQLWNVRSGYEQVSEEIDLEHSHPS